MVKLTKLCRLSEEMCLIERRIKYFLLPISIVATAIFVAQCWRLKDLVMIALESTVSISLLWIIDRIIILRFYDFFGGKNLVRRLFTQVIVTLIVSIFVVILFYFVHLTILKEDSSPERPLFFFKNLMVILFIFSLLVNGIYEIIFMFQSLINERTEKEKYKKVVLQSKLENLRNQINPHFLFNTFNALSELIEEDPLRASNTVVELSDLYRYVLQSKDKNWETLQNELAITKSFVEVLKIRYEESIKVNFQVDLEYKQYYLPPLVLQMLIENAIKHNEISSKKKLRIDIISEGDLLLVENNLQPRIVAGNSNGIGLKNIQDRYKYLLNKELEIINDGKIFKVKLPLIKRIDS